jgi:CheY-like chemotaxis protein
MCQASTALRVLAFERSDPTSTYRVLIIEDEALIALNLVEAVEGLGASCVTASCVHNALSLLAGQPFDAAIVDLNLAGEPADTVIDALHARGIPFLITTGYDQEFIAKKFRGLPLLPKPYMRRELEQALLGILGAPQALARSA